MKVAAHRCGVSLGIIGTQHGSSYTPTCPDFFWVADSSFIGPSFPIKGDNRMAIESSIVITSMR